MEACDGRRPALPTRVLVVIPTLDEAATIESVIATLSRGIDDRLDARIVVVDGGSRDGTPDIVERLARTNPAISILRNPARIQSAAVNLAVQRMGRSSDVLVRCDAHAAYPDGYVGSLVAALSRHEADAVVVPMDSVGRRCMQRAISWLSDSLLGNGGSAHRGGKRSGFVDHGHHAAFRTSSFVRAGGYDPDFTHNEDAEFDCRQRALGSRIFLDAGIRVGYFPRASLGALWRQYFAYGGGRAKTLRRHPQSWQLRQVALPLNLVGVVTCSLLGIRWPVFLLWPLVYIGAVFASTLGIVFRERSICALCVPIAAVTMHAAWASGFLRTLLLTRVSRWRRSDAIPLMAGEGFGNEPHGDRVAAQAL